MREVITIRDRAAAAVFETALQAKIVQTLIGAEMTLAGLARVVQTPLNLLHYHVLKCVGLGLVEIVREKPRAGRAVKHYRATAKTFFIPAELIAKKPDTEMGRKLREALDRHQAKTVKGINFTHDGLNPRVQLVKDPAVRAPAIELWLDIGLSRTDASDLIKDLQAVMDRYRVRGREGEPRYLVHLAAAKVE